VTEDTARGSRSAISRRLILMIFLLSGFAGLVYEVVWARQLVLVFGNTTQAISAILTGFFGGMAIGSVVGGRLADRMKRPLRMYAILELLVVIAVLLTPVTFHGIGQVYKGAFGSLEENAGLLALVRFGLAILALGPATIMMGATLPTLSRHLVRDHSHLGEEFGSVYAVNTLGAILGTVVSGLVLIELIGLNATMLVGVAFSASAGVAAFILSFRAGAFSSASDPAGAAGAAAPAGTGTTPATSAGAAAAPSAGAAGPGTSRAVSAVTSAVSSTLAETRARPKLALALAFVSGLTSLGYQNLWTRVLSSGTGSSSYIFTSILAIFLTGITVGAVIYARFLSRTKHPVAILGIAQLALAVFVLATIGFESRFFPFASFIGRLVIVVAPATLIMGIVFPMSSMLVADSDDRVGTSAGLLLGSNTLGAICGTFIVPFFLMPALSSIKSVVLIAAINAAMGLVLLWQARSISLPVRRAGGVFASLVAIGAVVLMVVPNRLVVDPEVTALRRGSNQVLAQSEDEIASVQAALMNDNSLRLYVGGVSMTKLSADTRMFADLPLMVRPDAKSMCVIAFGMGGSYRTALLDGLKVDAVELDPSVPKMFKYFYPDVSSQVLSDPNGHILVADGRNHVDLTTSTYDLMISDPPPPMNTSGTAVLFAQEFYQAAKARLNPGGVMMQWEFYGQTIDEFRSHVFTFRSVFKHVTLVWGAANADDGVMMLGSDDPITIDPAGIKTVLDKPGIVTDLSTAPDSPAGVTTEEAWTHRILDSVWISDAKVDQFAAGGTLITDDRPYTEYDLLRHLFGPKSPQMSKAALLKLTPQ
jgi:spermidine synthase